jgi:hypothetical protein
MGYKCIGCDREIGWDGKALFSYTCPCGATTFYNEEGGMVAPTYSLARNLQLGVPLPHLNNIVGESTYTSTIKEKFIEELRKKGFIWMEECEECQKDGTLRRKQEREKHRAVIEAEAIIRRSKVEGRKENNSNL